MEQLSRDQLNELADKWLRGSLTPEEKLQLQSWYDLDTAEPLNWTGKEKSYDQLSQKLWHNIQKNKKVTSLKWRWRIPAAAVVLITVGLVFYYLNFFQYANGPASINNIVPGANKAILILGNGQKVDLTNITNGQTIENASGIKITKKADGKLVYEVPSSASTTAKTEYNTIEAPAGGQWQVSLPDGSLVLLNASSSITFPTRFTGKDRSVQMKGEAYFEVAHNKAKPFIVESRGQQVEVLGTHFNINSYTDEPFTKTTLLEGAVRITDGNRSVFLKPGEQAQASQTVVKVVNNVDIEDVVAWKNGYFKFNESLESIMAKVARWYNVEVEYQIKPDPELTFTGKISRTRKISDILDLLSYNGDVHFKIEGRRIIVTK